MSFSDPAALRALLQRVVWGVSIACASGCGAAVVPTDGGADTSADGGSDANPADSNPGDADRCATEERFVSPNTPCLGATVRYPCGAPAGLPEADAGPRDPTLCGNVCPRYSGLAAFSCAVTRNVPAGGDVLLCDYPCGVGRRVEGFGWEERGCEGLGSWFAHQSALEGAAAEAFARLACELRAWGAPEALREAALRAREEELAHESLAATLAASLGEPVVPFAVAPAEPRTLEQAALENAVEGCVRESFGAAVAWWQAARSPLPEVREALARIAEEETRHASLAWELDAWFATRLEAPARARVLAARQEAARALSAELRSPVPAGVRALAGLPEDAEALALHRALEPALAA